MSENENNFGNKLIDFWTANMERNMKKISVGLGMWLMSILIASIEVAKAYFYGMTMDWAGFLTIVYIGMASFGALFISCFFGNDRTNGNLEENLENEKKLEDEKDV